MYISKEQVIQDFPYHVFIFNPIYEHVPASQMLKFSIETFGDYASIQNYDNQKRWGFFMLNFCFKHEDDLITFNMRFL